MLDFLRILLYNNEETLGRAIKLRFTEKYEKAILYHDTHLLRKR